MTLDYAVTGREVRWTHGRRMEQWRYTLRTSSGMFLVHF